MMHKLIEDKKIIRLDEKWKGFQNRVKTRRSKILFRQQSSKR